MRLLDFANYIVNIRIIGVYGILHWLKYIKSYSSCLYKQNS